MAATTSHRRGDAIPGDYQYHALHDGPAVQRFWHREKLDLLDWAFVVEPGDRILDIGAGSGVFADALARRGAQVVGIDANPRAVAFARERFGDGITFLDGHVNELDLTSSSFDAATCLEVIEHVASEQVDAMLCRLRELLRPGGRLLVTTPNYRGTWPFFEWAADRFAATAHMDGSQHVNHYHRRRLHQELSGAGLEVELMRTFSTVAPFVAGVSPRLARLCARIEHRIDLPFGNILLAVARKPEELP